MSDRGSIDSWRRDRENDPRLYDDVASREFPPPTRDRPRRKSILVDPSERAQRPRAARRNSQVRLKSSDDENGGYVPVRRPPIGSEASRAAPTDPGMASRHDLERKNTQAHRSFREKRDGYESDEGELLKRSYPNNEARPRRRGPDDPAEDPRRRPGDPGVEPRRRPQDRGLDPRDVEPRDLPVRTRAPPVQYGNDPVDPRRRDNNYLGAAPDSRLSRSASHREPRQRRPPPPPYDYEDDEYDPDYRGPPRRQAREPARPHRRDPRPDAYDAPDRRDSGYRSDRDGRRRPGPRYDDYYSDGGHTRGYNRAPPYYDDGRSRGRDTYNGGSGRDRSGGRRDRYRDDYDDRDRDKGKNKDWQATAATAFATYAMPMIKKEGSRFLRKQMQDFMSKQGRRG